MTRHSRLDVLIKLNRLGPRDIESVCLFVYVFQLLNSSWVITTMFRLPCRELVAVSVLEMTQVSKVKSLTLFTLFIQPPRIPLPASPARSVCMHMSPSRGVCTQRGYAHCYSSARLRMVRKYWSANTDDVTVTRRLVWHSEAGPVRSWYCV